MNEVKPTELVKLDFIDRVAEKVSPKWLASRMAGRQEAEARQVMLNAARGYWGYDATVPTNERPMIWQPLMTEEAELPGYARFTLITECRNLYRNFPLYRAAVDGISRRVGIQHPHFQTSNPRFNKMAEKQWHEWVEDCDILGRVNFEEIQELAPRACFNDGDSGLRFLDADGDLRLQVIEADRIAENFRVGINIDDHTPLGGVIWDRKTGRILGYKVGRRGVGGILIDVEDIPANEMLMLFRRQRSDQMRGVPLAAPVINAMKDLEKYLTATRVQANIAATFGVVVKREAAAQYAQNSSRSVDNANYRTQPLQNGKMTFLNPGEDISMFSPDVPAPQFDQYAKFCVRIIAIGLGTTYEMLMHDFTGMSYSSSKTNLMTENMVINSWCGWKERELLRPVYSLWVAKRMESGMLPFSAEAYDAVTFPRPAKVGIDANEDAGTDIQLIEAGLETFSDYFKRHYGDADWMRRLSQKAIEAKHINELATLNGVEPERISNMLKPGVMTGEKKKQPIAVPVDSQDKNNNE